MTLNSVIPVKISPLLYRTECGYIDVRDECWRRNVVDDNLRCTRNPNENAETTSS